MRASDTGGPKLSDPTKKKPLPEIREEYEYAKTQWAPIRAEAADDMQNVAGNPWNEDDLEIREGRPTIAPDEMTQYRNQVTNALRKSPRGIKFKANGNGANSKTAEFYDGKAREIEYRSHAIDAYISAAENVLQRGYGAFRIGTKYQNARDLNPDLSIEGFPDPDVVLPDPDIKKRCGQDMKFCYVLETMRTREFTKRFPGAQLVNFGDYVDRYKDWVIGSKKIQVAERWRIETKPRKLMAVVLSRRAQGGQPAPAATKTMGLFEDELEKLRDEFEVLSARERRTVDYPRVKRYLTNGLEILETLDWPGKYIPIPLMFGPVLYVPEGGEVKKHCLSLTRFAKGPWKGFCYAACQELEVLGMFPKAAAIGYKGQFDGVDTDWIESMYRPKVFLEVLGRTPGMKDTEERLPLPERMSFLPAEYLQAIEEVKEGFRRSIQAAMGSNFLPTQAQKINDKSGVALDKIDEAATQGTYHFVDTYEEGIRWGGVILEDLLDKVHDYQGETSIIDARGDSRTVRINDRDDPEAYSTRGDHLVTVETAPASNSQFEAAEKVLDSLVDSLAEIAQIVGPDTAKYILATSIKMRNLGPEGNQLAEAIMPEAFKQKDGKPPDPRMAMLQQQVQSLQQQLQQAQMEIKTGAIKEQIRGRIQTQIAQLKTQAASADKAADRAVKLDIAAIQAHIESMAMVLEELERIGGLNENAAQRLHDAGQATLERAHDSAEQAKNRIHERHTQSAEHEHQRAALAAGAVVDAAQTDREAEIAKSQGDRDAENQATLSAMEAANSQGAEGAGGQ